MKKLISTRLFGITVVCIMLMEMEVPVGPKNKKMYLMKCDPERDMGSKQQFTEKKFEVGLAMGEPQEVPVEPKNKKMYLMKCDPVTERGKQVQRVLLSPVRIPCISQ